ncbi:hypothetical protein KAS50_05780 [bacterium]|nr:hypothetical protein [bacterium]
MKMFRAKLLKDLRYISGCDLKKGSIVSVSQASTRSNWVIDAKRKQRIKVFNHEFEAV